MFPISDATLFVVVQPNQVACSEQEVTMQIKILGSKNSYTDDTLLKNYWKTADKLTFTVTTCIARICLSITSIFERISNNLSRFK